MDSTSSRTSIDLPVLEGKGGLRKETFAKVQEVFSNVGWLDTRPDVALNVLQHITALQEDLEAVSPQKAKKGSNMPESQNANEALFKELMNHTIQISIKTFTSITNITIELRKKTPSLTSIIIQK